MSHTWVIIPAGGIGTRMGLPYPKQLAPFQGRTVIEVVVDLFDQRPVFVAVPPEHRTTFADKLADHITLVDGGAARFDSVRLAFEALPEPADDDLVIIHDAARPFLDPATLDDACAQAQRQGAVIYAAAATDTIKEVDQDGRITATHDRRYIYHAQTPQIFRVDLLRESYRIYDRQPQDPPPTDEARLVENAGHDVHVFAASHQNRKLTHREDLALIQNAQLRIGHGYDVHRFDPTRPLWLGGVHIESGPGLLGHSDADVALHALIDALLGAAGLGDIGRWFPDDDPTLKDIRSTLLLEKVWADLSGRDYRLGNADITIEAQTPKLAPYIDQMRAVIADILGCDIAVINIKATTTEGMGFVGRKEGMAATAVVILQR